MTTKRNGRAAPDPEPGTGTGKGNCLSSLPDDLIGRILSLLPTPQAVLMSQLSRRWRRVWAHISALNLSVRDCVRRGNWPRFRAIAREALARFPTHGIPSISVEIDTAVHIDDKWYAEAMERATGSVRVTSLQGLYDRLDLPPCTQAESLTVSSPRTVLALPELLVVFGRLAELNLSLVELSGEAWPRPLGEFLTSCCPRLRILRLCTVRGHALRRLALDTSVLEVLDINNVDDLQTLDVSAANLRCLSVRSCFRQSPNASGGEVLVSAPRIESIRWYRSYPSQLSFRSGSDRLANVRWLGGPLKLSTLGRRELFDAPYTMQLLESCPLVDHLDLQLVMPDDRALLNWLGPDGTCEGLILRIPQLPHVSVLSLNLRWGFGGGIAPSLALLLSRTPNLIRLHVNASRYCFSVYEREEDAPPPRGSHKWRTDGRAGADDARLRLHCLREVSVGGLKGADLEECRVVGLLLASALPSLERISLTFNDDAATSVVDEIATEIPAVFPMASGRWKYCTPSVLQWIKVEDDNSKPPPRRAKKLKM